MLSAFTIRKTRGRNKWLGHTNKTHVYIMLHPDATPPIHEIVCYKQLLCELWLRTDNFDDCHTLFPLKSGFSLTFSLYDSANVAVWIFKRPDFNIVPVNKSTFRYQWNQYDNFEQHCQKLSHFPSKNLILFIIDYYRLLTLNNIARVIPRLTLKSFTFNATVVYLSTIFILLISPFRVCFVSFV